MHRDLDLPEGVHAFAGEVRELHAAATEAAADKDVWIVGDGDLAGQFADAGLLDKVWVHQTPLVLGAGATFLRRLRLRRERVERDGQFPAMVFEVVGPEPRRAGEVDGAARSMARGETARRYRRGVNLPPFQHEVPFDASAREQLLAFVDEHRAMLGRCLDDLTEDEARRRLVPSRATLLGLVKHATFVERVWFDEGVHGRTRAEIGIPASPDASFALTAEDTIASAVAAHRLACSDSRAAIVGLDLDDVVTGNRRGPLPLRWVLVHVLRELAQHAGHADILREQILAAREG